MRGRTAPGPINGVLITLFRNLSLARMRKWVYVSGLAEPVILLLGLGLGVGALVGTVEVASASGEVTSIDYASFATPGLLASAAMLGAVFEMTFNFYFKLIEAETVKAAITAPPSLLDVLAGEALFGMLRSMAYSVAFLGVAAAFGLLHSPLGLIAPFAAALIGFTFTGMGMLATSLVRSLHDFDYIDLAVQPIFFLSTTLFPIEVYPEAVRPFVWLSPLTHGVALCRDLMLGTPRPSNLANVAFLLALGLGTAWFANRRIEQNLIP